MQAGEEEKKKKSQMGSAVVVGGEKECRFNVQVLACVLACVGVKISWMVSE
jgi:hypothetical protein